MTLFGSADVPVSCHLFDEFPELYNKTNASVSHLVIVTLNEGDSFVNLLAQKDAHPITGQPPMEWCRYEGFDAEYHYAISLNHPNELYRCQRKRVNVEKLVREIRRWEMRALKERRVTTITLPTSELSGVWLQRAKLDSSLIPAVEEDVRPEQK